MRNSLADLRIFNGIKPVKLDLQGGMIVYVTGQKGSGKTTLIAHFAGEQMLPPISNYKVHIARKEAEELYKNGYVFARIPNNIKHLVYADIDITTCKDQKYLPRMRYPLDIDKMAIPTETNKNVHFFPYGATLVIDELMEKFDARDHNKKEAGLSVGQRKFLQIIRHRGISIITGCLLASGSDKRFRQMSNNILLIVNRKDILKHNTLVRTIWYCLEFPNANLCDKYLETKDTTFALPCVFEHKGNIWEYVDSYSENKQFIAGMKDRAIDFGGADDKV
jgi:energy-coupling factor transporter ATP-binding protein EcfA2